MTISRSELAPQLARLFYMAGLLGDKELSAYGDKHTKHKPILQVLTQDVSLETFKDLLTAEISLKTKSDAKSSSLHEGLSASALVSQDELGQLLTIHRPALPDLFQPLVDDGQMKSDAVKSTLAKCKEENAWEWLARERVLTAALVGHWLSRKESSYVRRAASYLSLFILQHNRLWVSQQSGISAEDLEALLDQKTNVDLNPQKLSRSLEEEIVLPQTQIDGLAADPQLFGLFPQSFVRRHTIVPFASDERSISLATSDPFNVHLAALIHWMSGLWVHPHFVAATIVIDKINEFYGSVKPATRAAGAVETPTWPREAPAAERRFPETPRPSRAEIRAEADIPIDSVSAVELVSSTIENAIELHATDIHIEPVDGGTGLLVRYRIDGELHRIMNVPAGLVQSVVSRVKVLANMDVTERRRPQDGHFELRVDSNHFDFRISTLPCTHGEKVVIRILEGARVMTGLGELGLLPRQQALFERFLKRSFGMTLVVGPTGSGKTSTLYAAMNLLNQENRNLVTIEDPVEYQIPGITQVQVNADYGLTFFDGLRSILRQDPDIIMIGEIRDPDTARIAIRAALTGHLVFSTLHTNTAVGAVDALTHLGAIPFMIANSLIGIVSQRLVRKLCGHCRKAERLTKVTAKELGLVETSRSRVFRPVGCRECLGTGYQGRTGVFEVVGATEPLRAAIASHRHTDELERVAREQKMASLREAGVQKVLDGVTSRDEVVRKIMFDI